MQGLNGLRSISDSDFFILPEYLVKPSVLPPTKGDESEEVAKPPAPDSQAQACTHGLRHRAAMSGDSYHIISLRMSPIH